MIIGLCGYARSGKDAVAEALVTRCGFRRYAFADVLKASAIETDPWISTPEGHVRLRQLWGEYGWDGVKALPEGRAYLQRLGTGMRDALGDDVWLDAVRRRIMDDPGLVVISDVRFPNEAAWVKQAGHLVRVVRTGVGPANDHISETGIDDVEAFELANSGTLDDLAVRSVLLPSFLRLLGRP